MIWRKIPYYLQACASLLLMSWRSPLSLLKVLVGVPATLVLSNGIRITVSQPLDALIVKETFCDDPYKFGSLINPTKIIDVGAGVGDTALFIHSLWPGCYVAACDPNPRQVELLEKNIAQNKAQEQIAVYPYAIGTKKSVDFYIATSNVMSSTRAYSSSREKLRVKGLPLSDIISGPVDYLKIDCEGSEMDVLESISPSQWKHLSRIGLEYHRHIVPDQDHILEEYLEKKGFRIRKVADIYNQDIGYLLAVRKGLL